MCAGSRTYGSPRMLCPGTFGKRTKQPGDVDEIQEQTRQHSQLINFFELKRIGIGTKKMDCDTGLYKQAFNGDIHNEMKKHYIPATAL